MSAAASSGALLQPKSVKAPFSSLSKSSSLSPSLNVATAASVSRRSARANRCASTRKSVVVERKSFLGSKVRGSAGSERLHFWQSDGPGREPKLRVVVRSALSGVPEKPLGLYDPSFDKDSCGVGFVAELSGDSSRKTVWYFKIISFYLFI